jgi:coenzyme PQQ precursor peptide PqqA
MTEWRTPEFEEIRMDAEINCYSSALQDLGAVGGLRALEPGTQSASRSDACASS